MTSFLLIVRSQISVFHPTMPFLLVQHFQLRVMQHLKIEFAIKSYFQFVYLAKVFLQGKCVPQKVIKMARQKL